MKKTPNGANELKHFIKKFLHAISTFSETERKKYPAKLSPLAEGKLFSDQLLKKYPEYLDERTQTLDFWIKRANPRYTTSDACLAEVVKILLYENELPALLTLAQHPSIPIARLHHLSWGHHFGWSRVKESAVRSHLFFNSAEATGTLTNGKYAHTNEYVHLLNEVGTQMDYPVQRVPHRRFLEECGLLERDKALRHLSKLEDSDTEGPSTDQRIRLSNLSRDRSHVRYSQLITPYVTSRCGYFVSSQNYPSSSETKAVFSNCRMSSSIFIPGFPGILLRIWRLIKGKAQAEESAKWPWMFNPIVGKGA